MRRLAPLASALILNEVPRGGTADPDKPTGK
jgi:hypothetical protein